MTGDGLIDVASARRLVLAATAPLMAEPVALEEALGRVLAEPVIAGHDSPPFDASAMDGFATVGGPAGDLEVVAEARAGRPADTVLRSGRAARISTGAAIPTGADSVVPVERVEVLAADGRGRPERVRVPDRAPGDHIRRAGEDYVAGEAVLPAGRRLGPAEIGLLASLGCAQPRCGRTPRVAIVVTGDELVPPGEPLGPGQIHDSNAYALAAQVERAGGRVVARSVVGDDPAATATALADALATADLVCVSGGVSVGEHDHVRPTLGALGVERVFWGVGLKPGKPTWFGRRDATLVFGLPGNPVSAMVTFELFARPALERLAGVAEPGPRRLATQLAEPVARNARREQAIRCRLEPAGDRLLARPTGAQGSHRLTSMLDADALLLVAPGPGGLGAGEPVEVELLG
jgi:molybdopterin molybdotransferase